MKGSAHNSYKESGIDWCPRIPEHWESTKTKYATGFTTGWTPPTGDDEAYNGTNCWANISDLGPKVLENTAKTISDSAAAASRIKPSPQGSLMFSFKLSIGQVSLAGREMYTNEAIATFLGSDRLAIPFAYYAFPVFLVQNAAENIYGAKLLNQELMRAARFPLPSLVEQLAIARFLDRETAKIDALIAEQQRLIELLQEKKQAVISHAVTKGLNPNAPMKDSGVEWLGEVPEHWEIMDLVKTTLLLQTGPFGSQLGTADYEDEGVAVINPSNITEGSIDANSGPFIAMKKALELERHKLYKGDLVIARRGEMGRCAVVEDGKEEKLCGTGSILVRPLDWMCTEFMAHIIRSEYSRASLSLNSVGSTMENLSAAIVGKLRIPVPPRDEQVQIVDWIRSIASSYQSLANNSVRAIELLQERRSALISDAVTGQIDVRGLVQGEGSEQ